MAIGVSPCPPFTKTPSVPGVLYDGNTVAWFKHNDARSVIKDGANRVSFWLDRYNYTLGAEMVPQNLWYTLAWWDAGTAADWSQAGVTLASSGIFGGYQSCVRNFFWIAGRTYKITYTIVITFAGTFRAPFANIIFGETAVVSQTVTYYYTPNGTDLAVAAQGNLIGSLTALSIKQVTGNHLLQATGVAQPLWSAANGILFDGVADFLRCIPFVFIQPEFIYFVGRQITWTGADYIYDGEAAANTGALYQQAFTPELKADAGGASGANNNLALNTFGIIRCLFNGANSLLQINQTVAVIGNFGAANMGGFVLGINGLSVAWSNIEVKEIILRRSADNAAVQLQIYNYLRNANVIP